MFKQIITEWLTCISFPLVVLYALIFPDRGNGIPGACSHGMKPDDFRWEDEK